MWNYLKVKRRKLRSQDDTQPCPYCNGNGVEPLFMECRSRRLVGFACGLCNWRIKRMYRSRHGKLHKVYTVNKTNNGSPLEEWHVAVANPGDRRGNPNGNPKLSASDVLEIRKLRGKQRRWIVAAMYRVHPKTIADIWNRRTWQHVREREAEAAPTDTVAVEEQAD